MNTDKTKVIWIGRKKYSKDKFITNYNLIWGEEEFDLLDITFNVNLEITATKNYQKAPIKINGTKDTLHLCVKKYFEHYQYGNKLRN